MIAFRSPDGDRAYKYTHSSVLFRTQDATH
jgi:hypothetical protein